MRFYCFDVKDNSLKSDDLSSVLHCDPANGNPYRISPDINFICLKRASFSVIYIRSKPENYLISAYSDLYLLWAPISERVRCIFHFLF